MTWRDRYQAASFRGVGFRVKRSDAEFGRRTVVHEYPQRDEPYPEDLGRKARKFGFEAFIIGVDYDKDRDALIEALEAQGPGLLVHPYYGRRTVVLASPARVSESPADEGGIARFSLEFVEAGDNVEPSARPDTVSAVESAADAAQEANAEEFAETHSVDGLPEFAEKSAIDVAKDAVAVLDEARAAIVPDLSFMTDYMAAAGKLSSGLANLIRGPVDLANQVLGLVAGLRGLARGPLSALAALRKLFGYGTASSQRQAIRAILATTPVRLAQATNQAAMTNLVRRGAVIEAARASSAVTFDSYDQAVALRDELVGLIDAEVEGVDAAGNGVSEPLYTALTALRVAVVKDITARGADLARVTYATLPATLPALVVAYRLYGDATRDAEVATRNRRLVRHPGFVPGGVPLEVLTGINAG